MALTKNSYFTDLIINFVIGTAPTTPSSIKGILCTNIPTRNDTNGTLTRPAYTGYADTTIPSASLSSITENLTGGSTITSIADITFPSPSVTPGSVITVNGFAIIDNSNNVLYQGALAAPLAVSTSGQTIKVPAGSLIIVES